ncbi:bifunctional 2-polyprenyl-6-hydroxyphenol methylase/3-demethylubiquinol 3-O-methyltransferase UbiG [Polycladidibacter stylochi]|uniref:bifunctional 2-polyprenyl-6-hydroxyphenol methylase/3-demethylubiquinol 3-O-methyltransferase UbiG n=1 Tax=Polycladidibacter stylochi TaxID=1807766 RepID=UPI00083120B7|nr:bifunctional 2-polyprenyl-6-hydroxyphenol methylase/3-demethylubiquinol 3-O-methyltransferase UbiG [Pseudovibrio stylochi]
MSAAQNDSTVNRATIDEAEVARFSAIAAEWWDPSGKFRPLHKFSPVRVGYIKEYICDAFDCDEKDPQALSGLKILDIGCGGGLLSEPMARMGASVTGADASEKNIKVASVHAQENGLEIDYRAETAEQLVAAGEQFDVVLNMEVIEHVADVDLFLESCAKLVKPGGLMFIATLNRTLKSYALAIIGAEYILRWLPAGTHSYDKFLKPEEIEVPLKGFGMEVFERCGVSYNPLMDSWSRSTDLSVNYMMIARRPKSA